MDSFIANQNYFFFKNVILNYVFGIIEVIWSRNFKKINIKEIGLKYTKNQNFWNIVFPIKRTGQPVNINDLTNFLQHPDINCLALCIGIQNENSNQEFIYALGLFEINSNDFIMSRNLKYSKIMDEIHLNRSILLLCRKTSSKGTAKIIKHFGISPQWIHASRKTEKYRRLRDFSMSLILEGQRLYENNY